MSPPGRPKGEYRSAQHEGNSIRPPGRPKGEYRSAQHEGAAPAAMRGTGSHGTDPRSAAGRTLPRVLLEQAARTPDAPCMRAKRQGVWRETTWRAFAADVRRAARALRASGIGRGDVVAAISENLPEVYVVEYAVQAVNAALTCLYPDSSPAELAYILVHSGAKLLFAEDQEQVDKYAEIAASLPVPIRVVYIDGRGLWHYARGELESFAAFAARGDAADPDAAAANEAALDAAIAAGRDTDTAALCYTSGTTGKPKGVVLTHRHLLDNAYRLMATLSIPPGIDYLSYISPAWAAEQFTGIGMAMLCPMVVNFAEKPETVKHDLRELGPEFLLFTPRQWEMLASSVEAHMIDAGPARRRVVDWALATGERRAASRGAGGAATPAAWVAERVALRALRDNLGLKRARIALSAGSGLSPQLFERFHAMGVPLRNLYGSTEAGLVSAHWGEGTDPATMGRLLQVDASVGSPLTVRLAADGELLVSGGSGFGGYFRDPEATAAVTTADGYYRTGDAIRLTGDRELQFLDRVKDLRRLATGQPYPPQFIENQLRASPYIRDAIVLGDETRAFVTALINVDAEIVGRYAETRGLAWGTFADLSQLPDVHDLMRATLARINAGLEGVAGVARFATLPKELDPDDAELTRSRKLRRNVIEERYAPVIAALYGEAEACTLSIEVQYQDGSTARIDARVRVTDVQARG